MRDAWYVHRLAIGLLNRDVLTAEACVDASEAHCLGGRMSGRRLGILATLFLLSGTLGSATVFSFANFGIRMSGTTTNAELATGSVVSSTPMGSPVPEPATLLMF